VLRRKVFKFATADLAAAPRDRGLSDLDAELEQLAMSGSELK
jgi:hypothetical protein